MCVQWLWEICWQIVGYERLVGQIVIEQYVVQLYFVVGYQYGVFGGGQVVVICLVGVDFFIGGQEFDCVVQVFVMFQIMYQLCFGVEL